MSQSTKEFLYRMFETSPGRFTQRETVLIRHFLKFNKNITERYGVKKLWNALNASDNNVKWIMKTFLVANLDNPKKHRRSLQKIISKAEGKTLRKAKLELKISQGKAVIFTPYSKYRFVMFPDRTGHGRTHIHIASKLSKKKIPKVKKKRKYKKFRKNIRRNLTEHDRNLLIEEMNEFHNQIQEEWMLGLSTLEETRGVIGHIGDLLEVNAGSLDFNNSGFSWSDKHHKEDWSRTCRTDRLAGDKLFVTYKYKFIPTEKYIARTYEYFDVSDARKETDQPIMWVYDMYYLIDPFFLDRRKWMEEDERVWIDIRDLNVKLIKQSVDAWWNRLNQYCQTEFIAVSSTLMSRDIIALGNLAVQAISDGLEDIYRVTEEIPGIPKQPEAKKHWFEEWFVKFFGGKTGLFGEDEDSSIITDVDLDDL